MFPSQQKMSTVQKQLVQVNRCTTDGAVELFVCPAQAVLHTAHKPETDSSLFSLLGWLTMRKTKLAITFHTDCLINGWCAAAV